MSTYTLRHAAAVEVASNGAAVLRPSTARRGLLIVGRRLLEEREAARRAGRPVRSVDDLNVTELRALEAAMDERRG